LDTARETDVLSMRTLSEDITVFVYAVFRWAGANWRISQAAHCPSRALLSCLRSGNPEQEIGERAIMKDGLGLFLFLFPGYPCSIRRRVATITCVDAVHNQDASAVNRGERSRMVGTIKSNLSKARY
jgi:hypothetical protein